MAYLAIYRRFRPQSFDEMVGQEHIVKTLVNQIKSDRIGHAYLFCGARGTGKTTTARIFARAINCEHPINGKPCGECETCKALSDPTNLDILEIDAASNNKVDDVREIREKVQYPPVNGKYKVYIIDEVHMLTTEAFNAILKTLEEPPKHAVFILATTEPQKLPATILSRCMRFDFKLFADSDIAEFIKKIYDELGKEYEDEAVLKIAASGEGSMRDALSVADLCVSYSSEKLTYQDVLEVLGASDNKKTAEIVENILKSQTGEVLKGVAELLSSGKSVGLLCKDLSGFVRDLIIAKTCINAKDILACPQKELENLRAIAGLADEHRLLRILEIFASLENDLKYSTHPRVMLETAALKAAQPQEDYNLDALISRVISLENSLKSLNVSDIKSVPNFAPQVDNSKLEYRISVLESEIKKIDLMPVKEPIVVAKPAVVEKPAKDIAEEPTKQIDEILTGQNQTVIEEIDKPQILQEVKPQVEEQKPAVNVTRLWGSVIRKLRADKNIMLWIACQDAEPCEMGGKLVVFVMGNNEYNLLSKKENLQTLQDIVSGQCNLTVEIRIKNGEVDPFEEDIAKAKEILGNVEVK